MHCLILLFVFLVLPSICPADTIYVPDHHATIQGAINAADNGDTVIVRSGTYLENIDFVDKAITVMSEAGPTSTVIDGNQAGSVVLFQTSEDIDSVLKGFTIKNGTGTYISDPPQPGIYGGGILCKYTSPMILDNIIESNDASLRGGGIGCFYAFAHIENNTIHNNTAGDGAGICCYKNSEPKILGNVVHSNSAVNRGGGIRVNLFANAEISDNHIYNNTAGSEGGGIWCSRHELGSLSRNTIHGNKAYQGNGGGIQLDYHCLVTIENNLIYDNEAPLGHGGGIYCRSDETKIINCTICENIALRGGGVYCNIDSSPVITNTILWGNEASNGGPSIYDNSGDLVVDFCDVQGGWIGQNINIDPMFVDPENENYRLNWVAQGFPPAPPIPPGTSPCINRGTSDGAPTEDIEGNTRPNCSLVCMGAYEYGYGPDEIHTLDADVIEVSASVGGVVNFDLVADIINAGRGYVLLGGAGGAIPGFSLPGGLAVLPMNWDWFTDFFIVPFYNTTIFQNFVGWIDAYGAGEATMVVPPFTLTVSEVDLYFAFCLRWPWEFVSNPVTVKIVP